MTTRAFLRSLSFVAFMLVFAAPGFAADISAEMTALMSDVLKPYRTGTNLPSNANTDPKAVNAALEILKKENLLDIPRPATGVTDIVERFGKALALGTRSQQFQTEIGSIYDAINKGGKNVTKVDIAVKLSCPGSRPNEITLIGSGNVSVSGGRVDGKCIYVTEVATSVDAATGVTKRVTKNKKKCCSAPG